ncbi:MAG TPA: hypothetical protein VFQ53_42145 [Kofleriaceae bacterium]|nr:hypothetical protein [Kofleriaceae bacterium]
MIARSLVVVALVGAAGCHASTQGKFVIPPGTQLEVNHKQVPVEDDGSATMSAFGWGGAHYRLLRDGKPIASGKLDTKFRPISLIWPPFGVLYVPKGLDDGQTYDLSAEAKSDKSASTAPAKKSKKK